MYEIIKQIRATLNVIELKIVFDRYLNTILGFKDDMKFNLFIYEIECKMKVFNKLKLT